MSPILRPGPTRQPPDPGRTRLGCGCGLLVCLALITAVAFTWLSYREARDFQAALASPTLRAENTRAALPYRDLPAGYHPLGVLTIPAFLDLAILSDEEPPAAGVPQHRFQNRGFLFARALDLTGSKRGEIREYLDGKAGRPTWLSKVNVELRPQEVLGRGTLQVGGRTVRYAAVRGALSVDGPSRNGLVTLLLAECPSRFHTHFGLWFALDPAVPASDPRNPAAPPTRAGTPADPAALADFLSHFELCTGS